MYKYMHGKCGGKGYIIVDEYDYDDVVVMCYECRGTGYLTVSTQRRLKLNEMVKEILEEPGMREALEYLKDH